MTLRARCRLREAAKIDKAVVFLLSGNSSHVFNLDESEINFRAVDDTKVFPPSIHIGGKTFCFVVVNCFIGESASKVGVLKELSVQLVELTASVEAVG